MLNKVYRTERIIQFGEGAFLRGFFDWMLQLINEASDFDASAVVVQPIEKGLCQRLEEQGCVYTHVMRGLKAGVPTVEKKVIDVISRTVEPYADFNSYLALAERESFRKWTNDFGYSTVIIGEAYSICVLNTGRLSVSYMDKVLTGWHAKGLTTLDECRAANAVMKAGAAEKPRPERPKTKSKPEQPRYGDFDVNDAFAKALERSYGED